MARYEITINRAMLEDASIPEADKRPIMVKDTQTGEETYHREVYVGTVRPSGWPLVKFGSPRSNGATVWVEADDVDPQ